MKKITFTLLTALGLSTGAFGQANVSIQAPLYDGSSTGLSATNGLPGFAYHRSCYLILQSELTGLALTNSVISSVALDLTQGCNVAVAGNYTIYLQNTSDVTYSKGSTWSTILTGMSTNYQGILTLPVNTGFTSVPLTLGTNFTYTGGGIYIACDWYSAVNTATLPARTQANSTGLTLGGAYGSSSLTAAPATLTSTTNFRPSFSFRAANTASNEVSVEYMYALGKVSKLFTAGHVVTAEVRNNSANALTNIPVTLASSGANTFNNIQTISSLAAGATTMVSFSPFNPTTAGLNNLTVSVPSDQDNSNNNTAWSQTVTCNDFAFIPPLPAASFTDTQYGLNPSGVYAYEFTPPSDCDLTGVTMVVSTNSSAVGGQVVGVVVDAASGAILASTNTITINGAMGQTQQTFVFDTPYAMTGGTNYYIGVAQNAGAASYFPFTTINPSYGIPNFYRASPIGSPLTLADRGYLAIGAVVNTSVTNISASASRTLFCKNGEPKTATLTASGLNTYSWTSTPGSLNAQGASVVVTPSLSGTTGTGNVVYSVIGTDAASGCKSAAEKITVKIITCTGLADNNSNGYNINVFPNPAVNGKSTVSGLVGTNVITVYNTLGQVVFNQTVSTETTSLDLSNQSSGNYLVKITDSNNESRIIKMVIQN